MGGATLPTPDTPGYGSYGGRTACDCLIAWLPVYERMLLAEGVIKQSLDVVQLTGGAPASGGTHTQGGAFDVRQRSATAIRVGREMGAPAFWARTGPDWVGNEHAHGVLLGCPHNGPAAYQLTAQARGYDGLGRATTGPYAGMWGYGGRDPHPAAVTRRTWRQGIAWAEAELARRAAAASKPPTPAAPSPEDDMTPEQAKRLDDIYAAVVGLRSEEAGRYVVDANRHKWLTGALGSIAAKVGVDIDEQAIASELVAGLAPAVSDAVRAAVAEGVPTDQLADAVVSKLGARLAPPAA